MELEKRQRRIIFVSRFSSSKKIQVKHYIDVKLNKNTCEKVRRVRHLAAVGGTQGGE